MDKKTERVIIRALYGLCEAQRLSCIGEDNKYIPDKSGLSASLQELQELEEEMVKEMACNGTDGSVIPDTALS